MTRSELSKALHSRPFQKRGARFVMEHKNVLIADEPGLGKTIQSIAAVVGAKIHGNVLVVAPKTAVYTTWPNELERWLADIAPNDVVRTVGGQADKRTRLKLMADILQWAMENDPEVTEVTGPPRRQWVLVSPNYLRLKPEVDENNRYVYDDRGKKIIKPVREALKPLVEMQWAAVIVDEAHETLAGATGAVKKQSAQRQGLGLLQVQDNGLRIALSGTPFRGKHENLWGILNWLDAESVPSYWKWIHKYFEVYDDETFGTTVLGSLKSEAKLAKDVRKYMIRRTKKMVAPDLMDKVYGGTPLNPKRKPPDFEEKDPVKLQRQISTWYYKNNPVAVWLPIEGEQSRQYEQMKKEALASLEGGELMANTVLEMIIRLQQFANSAGYLGGPEDKPTYFPTLPSNKFDWIVQFLRERGIDGKGPSGNRVIIASRFTKHVNLFAKTLKEQYKIDSYVLTGATPAVERTRYQKEFQSGKLANGEPSPEVFLMNSRAGGNSITLDAADDMIIVDHTGNPDDVAQLEDRIHRISRAHNVTIWNLCSKGTTDVTSLKKMRATGHSLRRILDDGNIEEVAKALIGG